jgi:hypothetical protein
MKKTEFDLDDAIMKHVRHETKVMGQYWLPPELVKLLKVQFAARPEDELVWRTDEGNSLVTYREDGQASDSVRQFWDVCATRPWCLTRCRSSICASTSPTIARATAAKTWER